MVSGLKWRNLAIRLIHLFCSSWALPKAHPKVSWQVMTARNRSSTREELIEGMCHDIPPKYLNTIVDHVLLHLCSAEKRIVTIAN
jgi:hypothetical protein